MNNRFSVEGILCDLEKAFDSVNHETVVDKLEFKGISGNSYKLISEIDPKKYSLVQLMHMLIFLLDGKKS